MDMGKVPIKSILHLCSKKRSYATAAVVQAAASAVRKAAMDSGDGSVILQKKESFWMKDPKTGNWIPEAHFDDIDVVALREKFLPRPSPSPF